jgi:hypothetical protein
MTEENLVKKPSVGIAGGGNRTRGLPNQDHVPHTNRLLLSVNTMSHITACHQRYLICHIVTALAENIAGGEVGRG